MRRSIAVATFVLLLTSTSLWAQRGSGRASIGGRGGVSARGSMASHSMGLRGGGHAFSGMRSGARVAPRSFNRGRSLGQPMRTRGFQRFHDSRIRVRFRTCFQCRRRFVYPWSYAGYYDPYWWWDSGSSYDEDYERDRALAEQMDWQNLEEQRMLHEGDQDAYARSSDAPSRDDNSPNAKSENTPATVLVFRDQRRMEVQNYAIVGQTLWAFASQRNQKIALSDLDLQATIKANEERGAEFRVPQTAEGQ